MTFIFSVLFDIITMTNNTKEVAILKYVPKRAFVVAAAAALAAMLATASVLSGCGGNGSEETSETKVITETQIVTRVVDGVYTDEEGNIIRDKNGEPMTAPPGTPDTDAKEKSESAAEKSESKKDSESKASESEKSEKQESQESQKKDSDNRSSDSSTAEKKDTEKKSGNAGSGTLKLGGKTFNVGDTVTCTYSLTCPDNFINYQATLNYDSSVLQATGAKMQGDASSGSVVNYKLDGKVKFNGIFLGGYDYSDGGKFMTVTYEIVGTGSTSPEINWEVVTDDDNKAMVVNGDIRSNFKISESYE